MHQQATSRLRFAILAVTISVLAVPNTSNSPAQESGQVSKAQTGTPQAAESHVIYCPDDGTRHPQSARFCRMCGRRLPEIDPLRYVDQALLPRVAAETIARAALSVVHVINRFKIGVNDADIFDRGRDDGEDDRLEYDRQEQIATGTGSGFVADSRGYIVTNWHVVAADGTDQELSVVFADGRSVPAELVVADKASDLAVLKVEGPVPEPLPWSDPKSVDVGMSVYILGHPLNLGLSVSRGVITSVAPVRMGAWEYEEFLSVDAELVWGHSGGPTINSDGEVIGVNDIDFYWGQQQGYIISAHLARPIVEQIIASSSLQRGYLGATLARTESGGVAISNIHPGSPAAEAGLQVADEILRAGSESIVSTLQLQLLVAEQEPGAQLDLYYRRDGAIRKGRLVLAERPPVARPMNLGELERVLSCRFAEQDGHVMVLDVDPLGHAAGAELKNGDIVEGALPGGADISEKSRKAFRNAKFGHYTLLRWLKKEMSLVHSLSDFETIAVDAWVRQEVLLMLYIRRDQDDPAWVLVTAPAPVPVVI